MNVSKPHDIPRKKRSKPSHHASDFDLDILSGDDAMFRWFLLVYLLGKPIQSTVAVRTWRLLMDRQLDTPWAILQLTETQLSRTLHQGGYVRYQHVMAKALQVCMRQLIDRYEGSLYLMMDSSENEDELSKRLQKLYGVGPKTAEIFQRETEEYFARRVE